MTLWGGLRGAKSYIWEGGHRVPFVAYWKGRIPAGTLRHQLIGTHDIVPTFVELAGGKRDPDQMLDGVSLVPVLLGKRGDDQPVRQTLLIQSSPGRDAFTEKAPDLPVTEPGAKKKKKGKTRQVAINQAWNELAKKGANSGSDGMAHALREGMGAPLPPVDRADHDSIVAACRAQLGETAFAEAWAHTAARPFQEVVEEVLKLRWN